MSSSDRKAFSHLQNTSNKKTIKKSSSLRFNEIDENNEESAKRSKLSARNSFDSSSFIIHESDEHENSPGKQLLAKSISTQSFLIYEDKQSTSDTSKEKKSMASIEIQCDIENEFDDECELTHEEIEIKKKNPDNYMRTIAEKIRGELYENLQENMEVSF